MQSKNIRDWQNITFEQDEALQTLLDFAQSALNSKMPERVKGCDGGDGKFECCSKCFGAYYFNQALDAVLPYVARIEFENSQLKEDSKRLTAYAQECCENKSRMEARIVELNECLRRITEEHKEKGKGHHCLFETRLLACIDRAKQALKGK